MNNTTVLLLCLIAIIISIFVSYKWKIHMGLIAMSFAFIIGTLFQKLKVSTIFGYWPDSIVFFLIASSLFYGFASQNGTLVQFGNKLLWKFRKNVKAIPLVFFIIAACISFLGANMATIVFLTPIAFAIGAKVGIDPILMICAVNLGNVCGSANPWTGSGVILIGLIEKNLELYTTAVKMTTFGYITVLVKQIIFMAVYYIFYTYIKGRKAKLANKLPNGPKTIEIISEKPSDFTPAQKKTFILIIISFILIVIPGIIDTWGSINNKFFSAFVALCQPQSICIIFALIASILKLGDTKKVISGLPFSTILLISGVVFLISIANNANLVKIMAGWFDIGIPKFLIAPALCILAGVLSLFSSAMSVVCPLLFPSVPAIVSATGLNPIALYTSIYIGANASAMSPFSTGGAMMVALAPDELKDPLIPRLIILAITMTLLSGLLALLGVYSIFHI